jgi:transposase
VEEAARADKRARLLMTQPGVGPIMALAFAVTIGDVSRFKHSNQVASYLGLIPSEHSSGGKQRLGHITKQGNRFVRMLLVEAVQTTCRLDEGFKTGVSYPEIAHIESSSEVAMAGNRHTDDLIERSRTRR